MSVLRTQASKHFLPWESHIGKRYITKFGFTWNTDKIRGISGHISREILLLMLKFHVNPRTLSLKFSGAQQTAPKDVQVLNSTHDFYCGIFMYCGAF